MNQEPKPLSPGHSILIIITLGSLLAAAGCLDRQAARAPAAPPPQAVPGSAAIKARVRLSVEPPPVTEPYACLSGGEFKGPAVPDPQPARELSLA